LPRIDSRIDKKARESVYDLRFHDSAVHYIVWQGERSCHKTPLPSSTKKNQTVVENINPVLEGGTFDPETVTILAQNLSFYPGCRFLDVADFSAVPALQRFVVYSRKPHRPA